MKTFAHDQYDHRLDSLEARALLSAPMPHAGTQPAATVVVADASFLNAGSDPSPAVSDAASQNDADMYDFGAVWGTKPAAPAGAHESSTHFVDLDNGAVAQDGDGPHGIGTPADVYGLATFDYGAAAPYNGAAPVITQNTDPVPDDSSVVDAPADAPVAPPVSAPEVQSPTLTVSAPAQPQAPQSMVISSTVGGTDSGWLDNGSHKPVGSGAVADPVVILNNFVSV